MTVRSGDSRQPYGWVSDYIVGDPVMSFDSYQRYRNDTATRGTPWQNTVQADYRNYLASALQRSVQPAMQQADATRREQLRLQGRQTNYAPYLSDARSIDSLLQAAQPYVQPVKSWSGDQNPTPTVLTSDAAQLVQQWMQGGGAQPQAQSQQPQPQQQSNTQPTAQAQTPPAMQITRTQRTQPQSWTTPEQTQEQSFQAQAPRRRAAKPVDVPDYAGTPEALLQTYQQNAMQGRGAAGAGGWA